MPHLCQLIFRRLGSDKRHFLARLETQTVDKREYRTLGQVGEKAPGFPGAFLDQLSLRRVGR